MYASVHALLNQILDYAGLFPPAKLPLDEALARNGSEPRCGLIIVDTNSGDTIAWVRIEGVVRELYDVAFIPGVRNPSAIGFKTEEILRVITIDEN